MSGETTSANMSMPIPSAGVTTGPTWASDLNASLTIIDQHDHSPGSGVQITPSGLNISSDLSFLSNSATSLLKAGFTSQSAALSGTNFLSFVGGNLYVNDGSGNQIPITSGGGVAGSPGSIGSLSSPASASYSAGSKKFTWQSGSSKAGAMDNGAVTIRETDVASANGITIASPTSLASSYSLTLPTALPASTQYISCTNSGTLGTSTPDSIAAAMTNTGAQSIFTTGLASHNWSPTITVGTGTINTTASVTAHYYQAGNLIYYILYVGVNSVTAGNDGIIITLPIANASGTSLCYGSGVFHDASASSRYALDIIGGDGDGTMSARIVQGTASITLAASDSFTLQGFYPVS